MAKKPVAPSAEELVRARANDPAFRIKRAETPEEKREIDVVKDEHRKERRHIEHERDMALARSVAPDNAALIIEVVKRERDGVNAENAALRTERDALIAERDALAEKLKTATEAKPTGDA